MTDTTNHAEVIRQTLSWFRDEVDYATNSEEARAVAPIPKALAALDALTRELEEAKARIRPSEPGAMTYEELWHESNASFYALQAENAAQSARIATLEEALEFYADPLCWVRSQMILPRPDPEKDMVCEGPSLVEIDRGDEARAAFASKEAKGNGPVNDPVDIEPDIEPKEAQG